MRRLLLAASILMLCPFISEARGKAMGWCEDGNVSVTISGTVGSLTQKFQQSYPSCTVTAYKTGTQDLATIYSDDTGTAKANPFTAAASGQWFFYADDGRYDVRFSAGGISTPFTLGDFSVFDTARPANTRIPCDPKFAGADAGASIILAFTDLPASGGTVDASCFEGAQVISSTITISKPGKLKLGAATFTSSASPAINITTSGVIVEGIGSGSFNNSGFTTVTSATRIVNNTASGDVLRISNSATNYSGGIVLRDFTIEGNKNVGGVTAGSNIHIVGGSTSTTIRDVTIQNVTSFNAQNDGLRISDNSYMITVLSGFYARNAGHGIYIHQTAAAGTPSQIWLYGVISDLHATGDGLRIDTGVGGEITVVGGSYSNAVNGINLLNGVLAQLKIYGAHFETNTAVGVLLAGGAGHLINGSVFSSNPTSISATMNNTSSTTAFFADGNELGGATTDFNIAAGVDNAVIGPQVENAYTITDAGTNTQRNEPLNHRFHVGTTAGTTNYIIRGNEPYIQLDDTSGAGTPKKVIQSKAGSLQVINDAFGATILALGDNGLLTVTALATTATGSVGFHLNQNTSNSDLAGTVTLLNGTSTIVKTFNTAYNSQPVVVVTPQTDVGAAIRWWVAPTTTNFTITTDSNVTGNKAFSYIVIANAN